ncbi:MAG: MATE family efflux transporter [bacterium]|nr:MATE family efflux transporter [bacterium]
MDTSRVRTETAAVVRLAVPVVLVQLGMMIMGTVDSMMLGRVSEEALAAGALGNTVHLALVIVPMGILMALDPLVAQAYGAGDHRRISRHLKQGLVMALVLVVPLSLVMWNMRDALRLLGQQPGIAEAGAAYIRAVIPGSWAFLLFVVVRQTLQAMSVVRPTLIAIVVANGVNLLANYVLVFGHWGAPALGVVGSACATSISRWVMLLLVVALARPWLRRYWLGELPDLRSYWRHLKLGVPIGIQLSLEMWVFSAVALLMGHLSARALAGHQIALNLVALSFMVPLGISGAAATRVGNAVGRRDMPGARLAAAVCIVLGAATMSISALLFWRVPEFLSRLFTPDSGVVAMAASLLPIAALFQVFDGIQVVGVGVLRGAADTRAPALIALLGFWGLGLPLGWSLAFRWGQGPEGLWWGLTTGLFAVAILLSARVRVRFASGIPVLRP